MVVIDYLTGREIQFVRRGSLARAREQLPQEDLPMIFQVGMNGTSYGTTEVPLILSEGHESEEQE